MVLRFTRAEPHIWGSLTETKTVAHPTSYDIRAELPNRQCRDFSVNADSLERARERGESELQKDFPMQSLRFDWRGLVVFVTPRGA